MTNYINQLSDEDEIILIRMLGFTPYADGFRKGSEVYESEGYKIYHSFNHNYSSSKDYDDTYLYVSDYDIICYNRKENLKEFFSFMYSKFGNEWSNKAIKYLMGKKATNSVRYIEGLMCQQSQPSDN